MNARCSLHFDLDAVGTCTRCGRFACASCMPEAGLCTSCAPLVSDPYSLVRPLEHFAAVRIAMQLVLAELPKLALLSLMFAAPAALLQTAAVPAGDDLNAIARSSRVANMFEFFIGLIGSQAMLALLIARAEGRVLSLGGALREGALNWRRAVGARFRSGLWILLFTLLLVVPGIWQAVMLMFANVAALRTQNVDALEASRRLVKGRFWSAFGLAAINLMALVGAIVLVGVAAIFTEEVALPRLATEFFDDFVVRFTTDALMGSLFFVGFVMLHSSAGIPLEPMRWSRDLPRRQS